MDACMDGYRIIAHLYDIGGRAQRARDILATLPQNSNNSAKICKKVVTNGSNVCVRDVATKPPEKKTVTARARSP